MHLSDCGERGTLIEMQGTTPGETATPKAPRYEPPSVVAAQEKRSEKLVLLVARLLFLVLLVTVTVLTIASE